MSAPGGMSLAAIEELAAQVETARPEVLAPVVTGYRDISTRAMEIAERAREVDRATAAGFESGGRAVYDAASATTVTRARLGDGGSHYRWISDAVAVVGDELADTRAVVLREITLLRTEVQAIRNLEDALARAAPTMTQADVDYEAARLRERYTAALDQRGGAITRRIDGYRDVLVSRSRVLQEVVAAQPSAISAAPARGGGPGAGGSPMPPAGGSPAQVNSWWRGLTPQQQADLIATDPGLVGNLDGVPIEARDEANRQVLASEIVRYEGLQRDARARVDGNALPAWLPDVLPPTARVQQAEDDLAASTARLDGLRAIQARLDDHSVRSASLVGFEPGVGNGRAIVAVGDPDTADNVVTYVPGTTAQLNTFAGDVNRADVTAEAAGLAGPDQNTAVVAWLGYDAPQTILPEAALKGYADEAEPALRDFQEGLRATHSGPPSHNTLLGLSYGSTVIGQTARDHDLDADTLVFAGSPGVGVEHVSELGRRPGSVYSTTAESDPILVTHSPLLGVAADSHGADPSAPEFGAEVFRSNPDAGHSDYWNDDNESLRSFGLLATGQEPLR